MTHQSAGGKARAKSLGRDRRVQIARRAARARWRRTRELVSMGEIRELAAKIRSRAARPSKVILFGSYARGEATAKSDVDLLLVEQEPFDLLVEQAKLSRYLREEAGFRKDVDLIVVPRDHYREWKRNWGCVEYEAHRDGVHVD